MKQQREAPPAKEMPDLENSETQQQKLPAKGARKPNADEQEGDLGSEDAPELDDR